MQKTRTAIAVCFFGVVGAAFAGFYLSSWLSGQNIAVAILGAIATVGLSILIVYLGSKTREI